MPPRSRKLTSKLLWFSIESLKKHYQYVGTENYLYMPYSFPKSSNIKKHLYTAIQRDPKNAKQRCVKRRKLYDARTSRCDGSFSNTNV